jgi:hypothetical protein
MVNLSKKELVKIITDSVKGDFTKINSNNWVFNKSELKITINLQKSRYGDFYYINIIFEFQKDTESVDAGTFRIDYFINDYNSDYLNFEKEIDFEDRKSKLIQYFQFIAELLVKEYGEIEKVKIALENREGFSNRFTLKGKEFLQIK